MVVDVNMDTRIKKPFPIQADWVGKLSSGLILVRAKTEPSKVELIGPKTILEGMRTLYTTRIPLNSIKGSGKMDVKLVIPSAFLPVLILKRVETGFKDTVEVAYEVSKRK